MVALRGRGSARRRRRAVGAVLAAAVHRAAAEGRGGARGPLGRR